MFGVSAPFVGITTDYMDEALIEKAFDQLLQRSLHRRAAPPPTPVVPANDERGIPRNPSLTPEPSATQCGPPLRSYSAPYVSQVAIRSQRAAYQEPPFEGLDDIRMASIAGKEMQGQNEIAKKKYDKSNLGRRGGEEKKWQAKGRNAGTVESNGERDVLQSPLDTMDLRTRLLVYRPPAPGHSRSASFVFTGSLYTSEALPYLLSATLDVDRLWRQRSDVPQPTTGKRHPVFLRRNTRHHALQRPAYTALGADCHSYPSRLNRLPTHVRRVLHRAPPLPPVAKRHKPADSSESSSLEGSKRPSEESVATVVPPPPLTLATSSTSAQLHTDIGVVDMQEASSGFEVESTNKPSQRELHSTWFKSPKPTIAIRRSRLLDDDQL